MMFSTKAEYGVRVMVALARSDGDSPVSLSDIADGDGLPLAYLLSRPATEITMAEVVGALEGSIAPIECITEDAEGGLTCAREATDDRVCATKLLWTRVRGSIVRT